MLSFRFRGDLNALVLSIEKVWELLQTLILLFMEY